MLNTLSLFINKTQYSSGLPENIRLIFVSLIFSTFCLYLLSVIVILCVFFNASHIRSNVRYLLFSHMLISDSLKLTLAFVLFLAAIYLVHMPMACCWVIVGISASTVLITPYNLALMSLERYIAICFPLRHGEICTVWRCNVAILIVWVIGAFPVLLELCILGYVTDKKIFSLRMICIWKFLQMYQIQKTFRFLTFSISFSMVVVTIVYTYIRVMLVAKRMGSTNSSASKATKTVLLHGVQLLLCLCTYSSTFTETLMENHYKSMALINFFGFSCLPQYISPIIYGIRDEVIRNCIRKLFQKCIS